MQLPSENNWTHEIYLKTKAKDKVGLDKIAEQTSIDCFFGRYNAIYLLAKEGDADAVNFLCHHYQANRNWAIMGAAAGGHHDLINKLLAEGAMLNYAMFGAGQHGSMEILSSLMARGGHSSWAFLGAAESSEKLEQYVRSAKISKPGTHTLALLDILMNPCFFAVSIENSMIGRIFAKRTSNKILFAAAQIGDKDKIDKILQTLGEDTLENEDDVIIRGAFAGHQDNVIKAYMNPSLLSPAAGGAGTGGHLDLVVKLTTTYPNQKEQILKEAAKAAAYEGHMGLLNRLIYEIVNHANQKFDSGTLFSKICTEAARGAQIAVINAMFLKKFAENSHYLQHMTQLLIFGCKNSDELFRVASFINDEDLRKEYLKQAHTINPQVNEQDFSKKAAILNRLMNTNGLNFSQALAWLNPGVRSMLVLWTPQKQKLPRDLVKKIVNNVSLLSDSEINDLTKKMLHEPEDAKSRQITQTFGLSEQRKRMKLQGSLEEKGSETAFVQHK